MMGTHLQQVDNSVVQAPYGDFKFMEINRTFIVDGTQYAQNSSGIQKAIDDCKDAGGGRVFLPPGTYPRTKIIRVPSNVWLQGSGMGSTIIQRAAGSMDPSDADGTAYIVNTGPTSTTQYSTGSYGTTIRISDLTLDGNRSAFPTWDAGGDSGPFPACLGAKYVENLHIDHVECMNEFNDGIMIWLCRKTVVTDCYIHDVGKTTISSSRNGISFQGGEQDLWNIDHICTNNIITDIGDEGIILSNGRRMTISNNNISACDYGIEATQSDSISKVMYGIVIEGNVIHDLTGSDTVGMGINWAPDESDTTACAIIGNSFYNIPHCALYMSRFDNGVIANNVIRDANERSGGVFSVTLDLLTSQRTVIANNNIVLSSPQGGIYNMGIRLYNTDYCHVIGNTIYDMAGAGINIDSVSDYNVVENNYIDGASGSGTIGIDTIGDYNVLKNNLIENVTYGFYIRSSAANDIVYGNKVRTYTVRYANSSATTNIYDTDYISSEFRVGIGKEPTCALDVKGSIATSSNIVSSGYIASSGNTTVVGTLFPTTIKQTDNQFHYFGTASDMSLYYDGSCGCIKTDLVAASDLHVGCGTDKTVVLDEVVWDDLRITPGSFDRPGISDPDLVSYTTTAGTIATYLYEFAKNDIASFTAQIPHGYKQGEDITVHLHWTPGLVAIAESGNKVGWKVDYAWANINGVFGAMTTADLSDACDGTTDKHQMTPEVTLDGHTASKEMSSMLICNVRRSDTGADDTWSSTTTGELPMLLEIDFHFPIDTVGSRKISEK